MFFKRLILVSLGKKHQNQMLFVMKFKIFQF